MNKIETINKINNLLESNDTSNHELAKSLIESQSLEKDMLEYLIKEKTSKNSIERAKQTLEKNGYYAEFNLWHIEDVNNALSVHREADEYDLIVNDDIKYQILESTFDNEWLNGQIWEVMETMITDYIEYGDIKKVKK